MQFDWSSSKDEKIRAQGEIGFLEIIFQIEGDGLLDVLEHPNKKKYPNQKVFVVKARDYVYLVPFVEEGDVLFLKTIIPSRKATKEYLK